MKRWYVLLMFAVLVFSPLGAATVSFLVIETGLPENGERPESSRIWENGLMDVFFEAGHIVSNAPIIRLESLSAGKLPPEARGGLAEAREGGADFFVVAILEYPGRGDEKPRTILRLFGVPAGNLLYEMTCPGTGNANDEFLDVKNNAGKLVPELKRKG